MSRTISLTVFTIRFTVPLPGDNQAGLLTEAVIALYALVSLVILIKLQTPEPEPAIIEPLSPPSPIQSLSGVVSAETLEKGKYS